MQAAFLLLPFAVVLMTADGATDANNDGKNLQGTWHLAWTETVDAAGNPAKGRVEGGLTLVIDGDQWRYSQGNRKWPVRTAKRASTREPKALDLVEEREGQRIVVKYIYDLEGDILKLCRPLVDDGNRPQRFEAAPDHSVYVFKRETE